MGADGYLVKPFSFSVLLKRIKAALCRTEKLRRVFILKRAVSLIFQKTGQARECWVASFGIFIPYHGNQDKVL